MRQLASIRTIKALVPIEGADKIELGHIDGWQCVVAKGEFQVGDKCLYLEVDSFLPIEDRYEFLRKGCFRTIENVDGFRIKTIRLRKQLSQGLAMPLSKFEGVNLDAADLTAELKILNYDDLRSEQLLKKNGNQKGVFPSFIPKTDEERIQNIWGDIPKDQLCEVTEKLEGMSATYFFNASAEGSFAYGVCSRNYEMKDDESSVWSRVGKELNLENRLRNRGTFMALQGELVGPGIEGNIYQLAKTEFRVYAIYDILLQQYFTPEERYKICAELGLLHVPILAHQVNLTMYDNSEGLDKLLEYADGISELNHRVSREGVVYKAINGCCHFKVKSNAYLLEQG